jgi:hypothetical protein
MKNAAASAKVDVDLDDKKFEHFRLCGMRKFSFAMIANSIRDILLVRTNPKAPYFVHQSAEWLNTPTGRDMIGALMPIGARQVDEFLALVASDPKRVLGAVEIVVNAIDRETAEQRLRGDSFATREQGLTVQQLLCNLSVSPDVPDESGESDEIELEPAPRQCIAA